MTNYPPLSIVTDQDGFTYTAGRNLLIENSLIQTRPSWSYNDGQYTSEKLVDSNWSELYVKTDTDIDYRGNVCLSFEYKESTEGILVIDIGVFNASNTRTIEIENYSATLSTSWRIERKILADGWKRAYLIEDLSRISEAQRLPTNHWRAQFKSANGMLGTINIRNAILTYGDKKYPYRPNPVILSGGGVLI